MRLLLALLLTPGRADDGRSADTLAPFNDLRRDARGLVVEAREACSNPSVQVGARIAVHVGPDGGIHADRREIRLGRTVQLTDDERALRGAANEAALRCLEEHLAAERLAPLPGGRGVVFTFEVTLGETPLPGSDSTPAPTFEPVDRGSEEYRRGVAEVVWANEGGIRACLGSTSRNRPVPLRWVIDPTGTVMAVDPPPPWLAADEAACVTGQVRRWRFPDAPGAVGPWTVQTTVDAGLAAPVSP